eukprot:maker-scaffold34_size539781-snap-gene-0.17 protein:Tk05351 transcript:maker-scaffold34_size539781-snap-gene-0.17-mRNA-1 annotation:"upf0549 protein c20orf43 homolog"
MGNDGGSIPRRDEMVKTKQKAEQKDKDSERLTRWQHCRLTQERLGKRIVACQLGGLYQKEAIIERLLDPGQIFPDNCGHIKSIRDVKDLVLVENPGFENQNPSKGDNYVDNSLSPWICPMTGIEMNGRFKFVFDWITGKVLSEKANRMIKKDDPTKIPEESMVMINPEGTDADLMASKMEARKAREKAAKKAKKDLKRAASTQAPNSESEPNAAIKGLNNVKKSKALDKKPSTVSNGLKIAPSLTVQADPST